MILAHSLFAAIGMATAPAGAVTPEQVQSLPLPELARLMLGEAGSNVVEVQRPEWPTCDFFCPALTPEQLTQPPPLHLGLVFYQRPFASTGGVGNLWTGLCGTIAIHIIYDTDGNLRGEGLTTSRRWGVPNGMKRIDPSQRSKDFMTQHRLDSAKCQTGQSLRTFFFADSDTAAYRAAVASELFAEAAAGNGPLPFTFKCTMYGRDCHGPAASILSSIRPARFSQVRQVDCLDPHKGMSYSSSHACYDVALDAPGEHMFIEVDDAYEELRIKKLEFRGRGMVVY